MAAGIITRFTCGKTKFREASYITNKDSDKYSYKNKNSLIFLYLHEWIKFAL